MKDFDSFRNKSYRTNVINNKLEPLSGKPILFVIKNVPYLHWLKIKIIF